MTLIKNKAALLKKIPANFCKRRKILLEIAEETISQLKPAVLFKNIFKDLNLASYKKIVLISIGKAARGMAEAAAENLPRKPDSIFIAAEGHPWPTARGSSITKKILAAARALTQDDLAIVLISGGGSAMLAAPAPGITLYDKIAVTKNLLKCGAPIREINIVRKHLSAVKGGRLAEAIYPAHVLGFVLSDVIGNDLGTIASAPISPDPSTFKDALKIINKYHVAIPSRVKKLLLQGQKSEIEDTPKAEAVYFKNVQVEIIADHFSVRNAAAASALKRGLKIQVMPECFSGEARDTARMLLKKVKKNRLFIACGETTVTCKGKGSGGRNQELVLSALQNLKKNQTILSIGTDGVDGICPEPIAGAIADAYTHAQAQAQKLSIPAFLKNNDSYHFFKKTGGFIKTGPTGTNLGDLVMVMADS